MNQHDIAQSSQTEWMGQEIFCYNTLDSTNVKAKELAEEGYPSGTLVIAESQTAGRGRRGRDWNSQEGTGIFMSFILKPELTSEPAEQNPPGLISASAEQNQSGLTIENASMVTLVCALAVSMGISQVTGAEAQIKWPNDIVMNGRKICGILTEMSVVSGKVGHVVVGIGINVSNLQFPEEIANTAGSLYTETGKFFQRAEIVGAILEKFETYYALFLKTQDLSLMQEEYNGLLANRNREVRVLDPREPFEGKALGITEKGELIVETPQGKQMVSGGEVSVRGIYGYV
ncbi:MAG: biotin--[acetyl-CoA-carboxylase] ligase [Agathobacter sp.]|nr:biotin--[acetyl-CoA-carboxylase] ligase [Agathobacter sp.]